MSLLPVPEALARLLAGVDPKPSETVPLAKAGGRVLAADLPALRTQPPFPASAMDGYALRAADAPYGARLPVAGTSRAGERFPGRLPSGAAVRIFTGAPVPEGADTILIQENTRALEDGSAVEVLQAATAGRHIRPAGLDFSTGDVLLPPGSTLTPRSLSLAASMGYGSIAVRQRPTVAILSNGDELVPPGTEPGPDQIVSSNGIGLAALARDCGAWAIDLGIAADSIGAITAGIDRATGADVLVVIGGASVGDHDLVKAALAERGMALDFWRIAMRPGKPLAVGRIGATRVLGLPGNPVSAFVCAHLFLRPLIRALLGAPQPDDRGWAELGAAIKENDEREDYVRARLERRDGRLIATPIERQDSSMLAAFATAGCLIVRPVRAPAAATGETVPIVIM